MSGHFHKIVGKTITGVYCRENEITPKGQVFIAFDDGTYFEMYTMSEEIKGIKGLMPGDLDAVAGLNHPEGKEICRYPESQKIMMWVPPLNLTHDQRKVLAVPTNEKITHVNDYWDALCINTQDLVDALSEREATQIISKYLLNGESIIANYDRAEWGQEIIMQEEFKGLNELLDVDLENLKNSELCGLVLVDKEHNTLERFLTVFAHTFDLNGDELILLEHVVGFIRAALSEAMPSPEELICTGKLLQAIDRLPLITPKASFCIKLRDEGVAHLIECCISDERIKVISGESGEGDSFFSHEVDWCLNRKGDRREFDEYAMDLMFSTFYSLGNRIELMYAIED